MKPPMPHSTAQHFWHCDMQFAVNDTGYWTEDYCFCLKCQVSCSALEPSTGNAMSCYILSDCNRWNLTVDRPVAAKLNNKVYYMDLNNLVSPIKSVERIALAGACNTVCLTCFSTNVKWPYFKKTFAKKRPFSFWAICELLFSWFCYPPLNLW